MDVMLMYGIGFIIVVTLFALWRNSLAKEKVDRRQFERRVRGLRRQHMGRRQHDYNNLSGENERRDYDDRRVGKKDRRQRERRQTLE